MSKRTRVEGVDVPLVQLQPLRERNVSKRNYERLRANIEAVGLIEPLCIYQDGEIYYIVDGYVRYQVLLELGVESAPCLLLPQPDLYTPNRQVNHLSYKQEAKMLRKAMETLDEEVIAKAFGMQKIASGISRSFAKELHAEVRQAMEDGIFSTSAARELLHVVPKRQVEILRLVEESGDKSLAFVKTQVLRTPQALRSRRKSRSNPWNRRKGGKHDLLQKLQAAERHYDFYSAQYRQYTGDLLKLAIHVRQILTRVALRDYLSERHAETLELFREILDASEGRVAG